MEDSSDGVAAARRFLETLRSDENLSQRLDQVVDDQILSVTRLIAAERGFEFSHEDLHRAVVDHLSLDEFTLNDPDGGAGKCKSDSGCRTPCVYCKSNAVPTRGDIGEVIIRNRFGG
ncbi:Nif11-like leader peptide family natural product precursor [Micromonospora endolithica]|uniref:Nif11 family protein n=1 Tax=Micromonospora endolithica TaxID=230091 RepID=A0A3A9ZK97_9ACTN|nr:Nif11-like leader peptide family natural product precursor [Micromonospora endolithica]RKN47817.1 Nif11 family protein [Micromonospora endolithica]TWJ21500.1 nitrogen fixation uncharacterized protein [Micromonospora endolithica]